MELKIVTFNIRCDYGQDGPNQFCYRSGLVKRKIEAEQPDIICFQEVLPHVVQWLKENLTEGIGITFHGFDGSEPEQTIDYIYLFPQQASYTLKKLEKWEDKEGEVWLSDHYPVCVVLELE